jgi:signal transduction histidine kinase
MSPATKPRSPISSHLRERQVQIAAVWASVVRAELPSLAQLDDTSLVDHLYELLDGLANWVDGNTQAARVGFAALIQGHAVQRLQRGIDLATLTREYALLRSTIMRDLMSVPSSALILEQMARVNEGLDEAILAAVARYSQLRDETRDRFVGILAHDLRTPLNSISLAAENLADDPGNAAQTSRLSALIRRSTERMTRMISDVTEFARAHLGGKMPVTLRSGDLGAAVREVVEEVRLAHPEREVLFEQSGNLQGRWDRDRVMQLCTNLLANAVQHGRGPITVRVTEADDKHSLILDVHDRGAIPADRLARLFDPVSPETPEVRTGLGLGLYIVRQIALAHGAHCTVTSSEREGTTFRIVWPRSLSY